MTKLITMILAVLFGWSEIALACRAGLPPLEAFFSPWFRGPATIDTRSHASQFAGRTTLASGSASQVVSTSNVKSDSLIFPQVEVALPAAYVTQGRIALVSADTYGTASTSAIYSGAIVNYGIDGPTTLASGVERAYRVNSVVNGISFALSTIDSNPSGLTATNLMWALPSAVPQGVKVNTIADGGYFTLGWADGVARPRDVTVMWEIKKAGKTA